MRRRSGAFHADTQEAYMKLAIECQDKDNIFYYTATEEKKHPRARSQKRSLEEQVVDQLNQAGGSALDGLDDFDFTCLDRNPELLLEGTEMGEQMTTTTKNSPSAMMLNALDTSVVNSELDPDTIPQDRTINCMLVGAPKVGKHDLINSLFPEEGGSDSLPLNQRLDLVIRKRRAAYNNVIYKFWFNELVDDSYQSLIKLYYRQCSSFIFVYDLTCRRSFEMGIEEIKKVQEELGKRDYDMFLVATNSDKEDKREVTYEEGIEVKMRFAMQHFSETNHFIEKDTQQLLKRIDSGYQC